MAISLVQLRRYVSYLRLRPFDTSTEAGRSAERYRRIGLSAAASVMYKCVHSAVLLISVPLAVSYLGKERYGLWMTISSVVAMFAFSDLGLGHGLLSVLSEAHGKDDRALARRAVSSAFLMLLGIAAALGVLFAAAYPLVPWPKVFHVETAQAAAEAGPAVAVFIALFLLGTPLNAVQAIQNGYQEGFAQALWQTVASAAGLIGLIATVHYHGGLPMLVLSWTGSALVVRMLNAVQVFAFSRPWLTPSMHWFNWDVAVTLVRTGFLYMVIGMSIAVGYTSDSIVVAQILGAEAVTEYSIPYRLFAVITVFVGFFLMPLWPAYGEAVARGDAAWVRRTLRRSLLASFVIHALASVALLSVGGWIISVWVHGALHPSRTLLLPFALYVIAAGLHGPLSMMLNGLRVIRFQMICWTAMAVVNVLLSIVLTKRIGVPGVMYGTVIATMLCLVLPELWYARRATARMPAAAAATAGAAAASASEPPASLVTEEPASLTGSVAPGAA